MTTTGYAYQGEDDREIQYNDFAGYFEDIFPEESLKIKSNVKLFKSAKNMVDEIISISSNQEMENMRKEDLIVEIANTFEQILINSSQLHLVEEIGGFIVYILSKRDRVTHPTYIYRVLENRYKRRYIVDSSSNKRVDIFSKKNTAYIETRESLATIHNNIRYIPMLEQDKQNELMNLWHKIDELKQTLIYQSSLTSQSYNSGQIGLPQEQENSGSNNNNNSTNNENSKSTGNQSRTQNQSQDTAGQNSENYYPQKAESKYYLRLLQYIDILTKLKDNVLRFPPSKELDDMLDKSLQLEIEILMPSIDMKFKRSIAQLDETIEYANRQSLNGASSVMNESAIIKDNQRGSIVDPNNIYNKFLEITHKLTPEQIDTRRPFISNIRRKMARYNPHLYYHIQWYEGSDKYNHKLAMGKFARSNLLKKKIMNN